LVWALLSVAVAKLELLALSLETRLNQEDTLFLDGAVASLVTPSVDWLLRCDT
jgi:hypothetical protein